MKTVTLTELRRNLVAILKDAAKNGDIIVTDYGKLVARITAAPNPETDQRMSLLSVTQPNDLASDP